MQEHMASLEEATEAAELQILGDIKDDISTTSSRCLALLDNMRKAQETLNMKNKNILKSKVCFCQTLLSFLWCFVLSSFRVRCCWNCSDVFLICFAPCLHKFLLEARQIKLLSELQTIYPIELLDNGEHAIRGLELQADMK